MYRFFSIALFLIVVNSTHEGTAKSNNFSQLYVEIGLDSLLSKDVFDLSILGYSRLLKNTQISDSTKITIIDFSKSSTEKRFFVVDIKSRKLLFASHVAHGKNSGWQYAKSFSNTPGSLQSSLGFYVTTKTYYGKHGYSLRLKGLESAFNSRAEDRAIVMHGANYVSENFIKKHGRLGRSWGCPALPHHISKQVIDEIKEGTCLFIFAENEQYLADSPILN